MTAAATRAHVLFHGVGTPKRTLEPGEEQYWIEPSQMEEILDALTQVPGLVISFDDSNSSDLEIAVPALRRRGLDATFFVLAGRLGESGSLDAVDVRALLGEGMAVGSHGMHHVPWRRLSPEAVEEELAAARRMIEDVVEGPVERAALPFGSYGRRTLALLHRLGYTEVSTSDRRLQRAGGYLQHRFSVRRTDTPETLLAELRKAATLQQRTIRTAVGLAKRCR